VHYHMISEASRGLFHKAIPMSGVALNKPWTCVPRRNWAVRLVKSLGYEGSLSDRDILEFLLTREATDFMACLFTTATEEEAFGENIVAAFLPCVEPYITENCFVQKDPVLMAREAWSNSIPCMVGGTSFEGILRANFMKEVAVRILQNFNYFAPIVELGLELNSSKAAQYGKRIKEVYYGLLRPTVSNQEPYLHVRVPCSHYAFTRFNTHCVNSLYPTAGSGTEFKGRFNLESARQPAAKLSSIALMLKQI